jgi:cell wall-associated NlpC family hydrolase
MKRLFLAFLSVSLFLNCSFKPYYYPARQRFSNFQKQQLVIVAKQYVGAPYKYGGNTRHGFDCSGLIYRVFYDAVHIKIPRTVNKLYKSSYEIHPSKAQAGDLVFFKIKGWRANHVGLMLDRSRFIHASKSKGVVISWLGDDYYRKRFVCVCRLR